MWVYNGSQVSSYWLRDLTNLRSLQNKRSRARVHSPYPIPQNEKPVETLARLDSLAKTHRNVQETWLHTLGNRDPHRLQHRIQRPNPLLEKRDMKGGFKRVQAPSD